VGAGRVGTALAVLLGRAGHRIVGVAGRSGTAERAGRFLPGVPVLSAADAAEAGDVVLIGTPDDRIAGMCSDLAARGAFRSGQWVAHLSGATSLDALAAAEGMGARTLSLHPLQTCPTVEAALQRIPGSAMAVTAGGEEGLALGEELASDVGARPFQLADQARALYHAAGVFGSNYLVVAFALAERLMAEAGVDRPAEKLLPLAKAALDNAAEMGPGPALTGPVARGDAGTVVRTLAALQRDMPDVIPAYVTLAREAARLAAQAGTLDEVGRARLEEVLGRST